jgi:hypothetical protein
VLFIIIIFFSEERERPERREGGPLQCKDKRDLLYNKRDLTYDKRDLLSMYEVTPFNPRYGEHILYREHIL